MVNFYEGLGTRVGFPLPGVNRVPAVTYLLLTANVLMWLAMEVSGGSQDPEVLLSFGAMYGPYISEGQYWRLFTAMFLHVGLLHLLFNSFGLFIFGRLVERTFGHLRFIVIYVLAGLAGSISSYAFNAIAIGAGASGAIFGVLGALAAFFVSQRHFLGRMAVQNLYGILIMAAINLFFGFVTPGIDNWAHMGGLVGGFVIGLALAPQYRVLRDPFGVPYGLRDANSLLRRWWVLPLAAVVLVASAGLASSGALDDSAMSHLRRAERHIAEGDYAAALDEVEEALSLEPQSGRAHFLRGKVLALQGNIPAARSELGRAIQLGDRGTRLEAIRLLASLPSR